MRYYECLFIVDPNFEMERLEKVIDSVKQKITDSGGKIYTIADWGKRKLAYLVNKEKFGNYVLCRYGGNGDIVKNIESWMKVESSILMNMTVRLDKEPEEEDEEKN